MPNLIGRRLDEALSDLAAAGFPGEAAIEGGGTFGVVDESNWTVCAQSPDPGEPLESAELSVDRKCGDTNTGDTSVGGAPASPTSVQPKPLTRDDSADFAALLAGPAFGDEVQAFVDDHHLDTVSFDGYISYMLDSDSYSYSTGDVVAGDPGDPPTGPTFRFTPLALSEESPIQRGDLQVGLRVRVTAVIGSYYSFEASSTFDPATETRVVLAEVVIEQR